MTGVVVERQMLPASQLYRGPGIPIFDFEHPYRTLKQIERFVRAHPVAVKSGEPCPRQAQALPTHRLSPIIPDATSDGLQISLGPNLGAEMASKTKPQGGPEAPGDGYYFEMEEN